MPYFALAAHGHEDRWFSREGWDGSDTDSPGGSARLHRAALWPEGGRGRTKEAQAEVTSLQPPAPGESQDLSPICNSWGGGRGAETALRPCTTTDLGQALLLFSVRWGCIVLEFCPHLCGPGLTSPTGWRPLEDRNGTHSPASRSSGVLGTDHTKGPEIVLPSTPPTAGDPGPGTQ